MMATPRGSRSAKDRVWALMSTSGPSAGGVELWESLEKPIGPALPGSWLSHFPGLWHPDPSVYTGCRRLSNPCGEVSVLSPKSQV